MKIYTKFGDHGQTVLFDGRRVPKNHLRIETYGTVDELNSAIGLALADCPAADLSKILTTLQCQLLDLGSDLATPLDSKHAAKVPRITAAHVTLLEQQIDAATAELPPLKNFILPGGTPTAARLHLARTICRRAERNLVTLIEHETIAAIGDQPLIYLNRLSDLLFTLARFANHRTGKPEIERESGQ